MDKFLQEEGGTSTVEYLALAALAIVVAAVAVRALLTSAAGAGGKAQAGIDSIPQANLSGN